jgi:hypothetical protein
MSGIVYFIQPSEFMSTNIYKIGYSQQLLLNRIKQYGNTTSIICVIGSNNAFATERQLISAFNSKFVKFKGNEYFIIEDILTAKNLFYNVCNSDDINISCLNTQSAPVCNSNLNVNINNEIVVSNNNKYACLLCNFTTHKKYNYDCHLLSKKHIKLSIDFNKNDNNIYECKICKYWTYKHSNYTKHLNTDKHQINSKHEEKESSGLKLTEDMFYDMLNSNKEIMNCNKELVKSNQLLANIIQNGTNNTTINMTNSCNNNKNTTFNLH